MARTEARFQYLLEDSGIRPEEKASPGQKRKQAGDSAPPSSSRRGWGPQRPRRRQGAGAADPAAPVSAIPVRAGALAAPVTLARPTVPAWQL
jgi:hypothetical protein